MGGTWGWGILRKGPFKSGPVGCVCCTLDCQVSGGCWTGQTSSDTGLTRLVLEDSCLCYICSSFFLLPLPPFPFPLFSFSNISSSTSPPPPTSLFPSFLFFFPPLFLDHSSVIPPLPFTSISRSPMPLA